MIVLLQTSLLLFQPGGAPAAAQQNNAPPVSIPWGTVENILANRSFTSGDELFQLLYILYYQEEGKTSFRLENETLAKMKQKLNTLFPLAGCESIEVRDARVVFLFAEDQVVAIPNTWRQAFLKIDRKLILAIKENQWTPQENVDDEADPDTKSIHFLVQEGSMQLHFSFLLKLFGGTLRDANGNELIYQINNNKKISRMQFLEIIPLAGDRLKVTRSASNGKDPEMQWIDILHPDFPGVQDIGISATQIAFLGTDIELLPDYMIRIGKKEPLQNEKAWNWFTNNIKSAKIDRAVILPTSAPLILFEIL